MIVIEGLVPAPVTSVCQDRTFWPGQSLGVSLSLCSANSTGSS